MKRALTICIAAVTAFAAPAAHADGDFGGGYTCGLAATDPTGSGTVTGAISGGPWEAPRDAVATIRCVVQVVRPNVPPQVVATYQSAPSATASFAAVPVVFGYAASAGTALQVCTEVTVFENGDPPRVHRYDADGDPANGAQCADAETGVAGVYTTPPKPDGDVCVYVQHNLQPPPGDVAEVCVPFGPL